MTDGVGQLERWQLKLREVDALSDGIGMPVDRDIRETVAVLQLLGLHTQQSCEGHIGWGLSAPWIALYVPEAEKLRKEIIPLEDRLEEFDEENEEFERVLHERNRLREQHDRCEAQAWTILFASLEKFYRQYPDVSVSYEHRIVLFTNGRLTIQGLMLQPARDAATQTLKLQEYQEEMRRFTAFLKRQFLKNEV